MNDRHACDFSVARFDDAIVVRVYGEIDVAVGPSLADALADAAATSTGEIVVNLSGVTFMGSTGISVLLAARQALEPGRSFVVEGASAAIHRVFEITGLTEVLGARASSARR